MVLLNTSQDNYKELWLLYYNTVVDILKVYRYRDENGKPYNGEEFHNKVEEVLKNRKIID